MNKFKEYIHEGLMYKLYVPNGSTKENSLPLVVMLHGCEQDPDQFAEETKMNQLAEKENFIVLYPTMNRWYNPLFDTPHKFNLAGCWNWFLDENQHRGKGLPKNIVDMIYGAERNVKDNNNFSIDWNKVYAAGFSSGGAMACILGVTYPDIFSGIAVCSGLPYQAASTNLWNDPWNRESEMAMRNGVKDPYECGNKALNEMKKAFTETGIKRKIPMIAFHGMNDTTVHPKNGEQVVTQWGQTHNLIEGGQDKVNLAPTTIKVDTIKNGRSYTQEVYNDSNDDPFMELWLVHDMDHGWSGGSETGKFTDPLGPDATSMIWDFFQKVSP
ncbi:PHB depolymerase family esterase [Bacillus sp. V3B]|uniref:extracellular catalytic domain type 1 short-chain-length polyhydroxyalkanoate depolymerase n=1 Tax=Bacillus sp. V3B TaxID=2804915 RepID=UPI00210DBD9E|nr:PHB depolymerase family esterase [Bacillus sp. V3B]MCQ6276913.1 PHB depolymerase family esterase [Bacillus sp. V3B]